MTDGWQPLVYPLGPGWKAEGTSRATANKIAPRAESLRSQVLDVLKGGSFTADEVAAIIGKPIWSIRPRLSELLALHEIKDTGLTRPNESGSLATVWSAIINVNGGAT